MRRIARKNTLTIILFYILFAMNSIINIIQREHLVFNIFAAILFITDAILTTIEFRRVKKYSVADAMEAVREHMSC
jgi:hypothetical protein